VLIDPRCDLRLFIEGYSCPIMSASINTAVKLTATVEVLPTKQVRDLTPMTNIVIGYRDVSGKKATLTDEVGVTYSVIFVGMVVGVAINKSGTSRSASLACTGHQTLLERHYTYLSNITGGDQSFSQEQNFIGAASFLRKEQGRAGLAAQVAAVFQDKSPPLTPGLSELTGPPRGSIKLLEKCIGVTLPAGSPKEDKVHGAQHEFFAHASNQCRLLFQIDGVSTDEGLNEILDRDTSGAVMSQASAQMSDSTDLATMLDILLKHMYYSFMPVGAPRTYISSDKEITQRTNVLTELTQKYPADIVSAGTVPSSILVQGSVVVDFSDAASASYADVSNGDNKDEIALNKFTDFIKTPEGGKKVLPSLIVDINKLVPADRKDSLLERIAPFIFEGVKIYHKRSINPSLSETSAQTLNQLVPFLIRSVALSSRVDDKGQSTSFARVVSYNIIPDLSFCTVPTCNVIFPNQISTFSYTKNTFNMPTRLLLYGSLVPNAADKKGSVAGYYAPSTSAFKNQGAVAREKEEIPLLAHEKFTGVVPSYASISFFEKFKSVDLSNDNMMLRIANFNLMLKRYESTGISCTGPFNPFIAVGFPIAFIDVDDITAETPAMYVGILSSVSHTYNGAGSASTSYTVKCVREVGEVDALFGDALLRSTNSVSTTGVVLTQQNVATGDNLIESAFLESIRSLENTPAFLAAYESSRDQEIILNENAQKFRSIFTHSKVLQVLQRALPQELSGSNIIAAEWVGTNVFTPKTLLDMLNKPLNDASAVVEYVNKEPIVDNIASCAKYAADILESKFVADKATSTFSKVSDDSIKKELVSYLRSVESDSRFNVQFSVKALNDVHNGRSIFQSLFKEVDVTLKQGIHRKESQFALSGKQTVTWFSLLPIDTSRITSDAKAGNPMFYFGGGISFPSNALTEVSVFTQASSGVGNEQATAAEKVAVEELYRPPWFSETFSIANIGQAVYQRILGCGSVQDVVPTSVPKDTSVNVSGGSLLAHSTQLSLLNAYQGYRRAPVHSKGEFVNAFVRRPISSVLDVLGDGGLLTTPIADPCVVDFGRICNVTKVRDLAATDETSKSLTFSPSELVSEKRVHVLAYINSTKGDAFR
jgi:hypothetical protein